MLKERPGILLLLFEKLLGLRRVVIIGERDIISLKFLVLTVTNEQIDKTRDSGTKEMNGSARDKVDGTSDRQNTYFEFRSLSIQSFVPS